MALLERATFVLALAGLCCSIILIFLQLYLDYSKRSEIRANQKGGREHLAPSGQGRAGRLSIIFIAVASVFLTVSIVARATISGHGPFSNMYEFTIAFSWGIMVASLLFAWRYGALYVSGIAVLLAIGLLSYAYTLPSRVIPLVPALQQSLLLTIHVASAIVAYGSFALAFGAAVLYLVRTQHAATILPSLEALDHTAYVAVAMGFPFMALVIVLGALWADVAWGRYWAWDPKETASLVTMLIYAGYLHARVIRRWRGTRTAVLLIAGFLAVLMTFFGNYFFGGLHGYS